MPTLPVYNSQRNIKAMPQAPMRDEAGFPFEVGQKIAATVENIATQWQNQKDTMEYTEAKAKYEEATLDIFLRAEADPDFRNAGKYYDELKKAKEFSTSGITNKSVANQAAFEIDHNNKIAGMKIGAQFNRKQLEYNKVQLVAALDSMVKSKFSSATEAEKIQKDIDIDALIAANLSNGTIDMVEADVIKTKSFERAAEFDAQYYPDKFLANRDEYAIPDEKKTELTKIASSMKERIKKEEVQMKIDTQAANSIKITESLIGGDKALSVGQVSQMIGNEEISPEYGRAYINALMSDKITDQDVVEDKSGFTSYIYGVFDSSDKDAVVKAMTSVLNGGADGRINQKEMNTLLQIAVEKNKELVRGDSAFSKFGNAIMGMLGFGKEKPKVMEDYVNEVVAGKTPEEAKKTAVEKGQIRSNPNRTRFEIGQVVNHNGMSFEVLRFDENGNPVFKKL